MDKRTPVGPAEPDGRRMYSSEDVRMPLDAAEMRKARLALGILSGRKAPEHVGIEDHLLLGYDPSQFACYGRPDDVNLKERAEEVLFGLLFRGGEKS